MSKVAPAFSDWTSVDVVMAKLETCALLAALLMTFQCHPVRSEDNSENALSIPALSARLELLEEGFRRILTALTVNSAELHHSVNTLIENDPVIHSIIGQVSTEVYPLSPAVNHIRSDPPPSYLYDSTQSVSNHSVPDDSSTAVEVENLATVEHVEDIVKDLKGALMCSLAPLMDIQTSKVSSKAQSVLASLSENGSLTVEWQLPSDECMTYLTEVAIRIYDDENDVLGNPLRVPKECLNRHSNTLSVLLPSPSGSTAVCTFPLRPLMECKTYNVEVIPNYMSIGGKGSHAEIIVPPTLDSDSMGFKFFNTSSKYDTMNVSWIINSEDCARLMTSVNLRIYEEKMTDQSPASSSVNLPKTCLKGDEHMFSASLAVAQPGNSEDSCPDLWKPFDRCRKYQVEMETEFASTWKSATSSWNIFTQEPTDAASRCCNLLTAPSGSFTSTNVKYRYVDSDEEDDSNGVYRPGQLLCTWSISVQPNHTVWLTFTDFKIYQQETLNIYDGTYRNSRLLLSHSKDSKPTSVRSTSNNLFIQIIRERPHPRDRINARPMNFTAVYASVGDIGVPLAPDCGGYIRGNGHIVGTGSSYGLQIFMFRSSVTYCVWYIEGVNDNHTVLLSSSANESPNYMIVYDGWSTPSPILYNRTDFSSNKPAIYSSNSKLRVLFNSREQRYIWTVSSIYTPECWQNLNGSSGSVNSPNYPAEYSNLVDCRWYIRVASGAKIRLTFTYFETQESYDLVHVYDGRYTDSPVLLETSGKVAPLLTVVSTSNELLVRFTSNHDVAYTGFLAIYTSI